MRPVPARFRSIDETRLRVSEVDFPVSYAPVTVRSRQVEFTRDSHLFQLYLVDTNNQVVFAESQRPIGGDWGCDGAVNTTNNGCCTSTQGLYRNAGLFDNRRVGRGRSSVSCRTRSADVSEHSWQLRCVHPARRIEGLDSVTTPVVSDV